MNKIIPLLIHTCQSKQFNYEKKIFAALPASCLFACIQNTETASAQNIPAEADGYLLDSSANIDFALKSAKCIESGDIIYIYYKFIT